MNINLDCIQFGVLKQAGAYGDDSVSSLVLHSNCPLMAEYKMVDHILFEGPSVALILCNAVFLIWIMVVSFDSKLIALYT